MPATPGGGAADTVLALHRAGQLAERYPEVAPALAGAAGADLLRAGRLLERLDPAEVLAAHPDVRTVTIAVTGPGTVAPVLPALFAETARHGLLLRPHLTEFGTHVLELSDPAGRLYAARPDLTACLLDPMTVFGVLPAEWTPQDVEAAWADQLRVLRSVAGVHERTATGTLVLNTVPLPQRFAAELVDHRSRARLGAVWREANARLLRLTEDFTRLVVLDLDALALDEGLAVTDPRQSLYAKAHLAPDLLARYAREIGHLARHAVGRTKKVLVLDLDGTLWGGILGEDGVEGVEVADTYRGAAFHSFQRVLKHLSAQGVLLAVASKNDPDLVRRALTERPDMALRESDFVRVVAGWHPKHESLADIAAALNLGVDSFVFVDDSPAECGLIRDKLPSVAVVQVDTEPAHHAERLLRDGWFTVGDLTPDDRARVARYREEVERRDFLESFDSVEDYLAELDVSVRLADAEPAHLPRVSQLTLRTNQFNLTTARLQPGQVQDLIADPDARVLTVHSGDRFGDNGLVGVLFLRRHGDELAIENFVLSCRVFSRGIEQACLAAVLDQARADGVTALTGTYIPSARNGIVEDFYPRYGFAADPASPAAGPARAFRRPAAEPLAVPAHVRLTADLTDRAGEAAGR